MASELDRQVLLRARLVDLLRDDEECLEELYLGCNFELESLYEEGSPCRRLRDQFRLAEIAVELETLNELRIVRWRDDSNWPPSAQLSRRLFHLTELGHQYWTNVVASNDKDSLYKVRH